MADLIDQVDGISHHEQKKNSEEYKEGVFKLVLEAIVDPSSLTSFKVSCSSTFSLTPSFGYQMLEVVADIIQNRDIHCSILKEAETRERLASMIFFIFDYLKVSFHEITVQNITSSSSLHKGTSLWIVLFQLLGDSWSQVSISKFSLSSLF
mmetsp:Transcript_34903/g.45006  ORF Transcript_34903/g.45006 Transcript_34903/m.45006 type:complete len:151 (-) Transcript_34903:22-474(-)